MTYKQKQIERFENETGWRRDGSNILSPVWFSPEGHRYDLSAYYDRAFIDWLLTNSERMEGALIKEEICTECFQHKDEREGPWCKSCGRIHSE